jgi:hypothetical protein
MMVLRCKGRLISMWHIDAQRDFPAGYISMWSIYIKEAYIQGNKPT